jgi:hypothetical protein
MNRSSVPGQQQEKQQQQQKPLRIKKQEKTLEFHSRLIEAAEVRLFAAVSKRQRASNHKKHTSGAKALILRFFYGPTKVVP